MKKMEITAEQRSFLVKIFQTKLSSTKGSEVLAILPDFVKFSQSYLEQVGLEITFAETLSFLMREFHEEISAVLRAEMTTQGISNDQASKVVNWFSELVYRMQIGGEL